MRVSPAHPLVSPLMSNPSQPEFWNSRYLKDNTPWDFGGVPADLKNFLKKDGKGARVLIPGCGSGYEIQAFSEANYEVTAVDFSSFAVQRARRMVSEKPGVKIIEGDFFAHDFPHASFDFVYERFFVAAIPIELRQMYRDRMAQLLKYRGLLIGYYYYSKPDSVDGPPFGFAWGTADELFSRYFLLVKDEPVSDSLPAFAGRERWQERRRTSFQE